MVRLKTMDEVDFVVDPEIAFQSELIKGMSTDCPDENQDMAIPLPIVHSRILTKVIEFCEYHRPDRPPLMRPKDPPPIPNNTPILVTSNGTTWTVATVDEANARATAGTISLVGYRKGGITEAPGESSAAPTSAYRADPMWIRMAEQFMKRELQEKEAEEQLKQAAAGIEKDKVEEPAVEDTEKEKEEPEMQRMTLAEEEVADKAWDTKFIEVDQDTLFSLVLVANYLYIPGLLEVGLSTIGAAVKGKPPKEVRTMYGIPDNIDPSRPPGPSNKSMKSRSKGKKTKAADGSDDSMDVDDDDDESESEEEKPVELPPQRGTRSRPVRATRKAVNYSFEGENVD